MAKKVKKSAKKAVKRVRVLGVAVEGTTKGNVLSELLDGKPRTLESLKECRVIDRDSIGWRLTLLNKAGKHAERPFKLEIGDDKVRLVYTKGGGGESKPSKGKVKPMKKAGTAPRASVRDVPAAEDEE